MNLLKRYISFCLMYKGRINRKAFVLYSWGLMGIFYFSILTLIFCSIIFSNSVEIYFKVFFALIVPIMFVLCLLSISGQMAIVVRRFHDLDLSSWWLLLYTIIFVPLALTIKLADEEIIKMVPSIKYLILFLYYLSILSSIYILYFIKGSHGTNRYGPNPLQKHL